MAVFGFSAMFHEVVISIPFRYFALHAFFGMLAQAPLVMISKCLDRRFDNPMLGNVMFWMIFCVIGQPMGAIMYYYDFWKLSQ
jgi:diacylglycerol O-acyltransferase 1